MMEKIKDFFKGIRTGYKVGKKGGVLDVMWCSSCGREQPIYMDSSILRCAACDKVIKGVDEGVVEIDVCAKSPED